MTKQRQHLPPEERKVIISLITIFEEVFDSKLGTWNSKLVDLELKDNTKPVCLWPYQVPKVHKEMFRK